MQISYRKLWILLAEKELNRTMLQNMTGLSSASIAKLSKNENVNTATLLKICSSLKCNLGDIVDATEGEHWRSESAPDLFALHSRIVDFHGIVGGAAAGQRQVADEARKTDAAGVHAEAGEVVVAQQLARHLGNAVDGVRPLDGVLRRVVVRRGGAEGTD